MGPARYRERVNLPSRDLLLVSRGSRSQRRTRGLVASIGVIGVAGLAGLVGLLAGCGGAATPASTTATPDKGHAATAGGLRGTVDPLPFLREPAPVAVRSWVKPRAARLDVGDQPSSPENEPQEPIEVMIVEPGPTLMRVAVTTPGARFAVWVERRDLLAVMSRDVSVRSTFAPAGSQIGAALHAGASVDVLERTEERSRVRYSGALELELWVPNDALTDAAEPVDAQNGMAYQGPKLLHGTPGLAIRAEPRWGSPLIAALARIYYVTEVRALDEAWSEVQYADRAVTVRGYASRRDPPVQLASRTSSAPPVTPLETNDKLTAGTCLYARTRGELVGIAGDVAAAVVAGEREGWWAVTLETPWGPMTFAARRTGGTWQPCDAAP